MITRQFRRFRSFSLFAYSLPAVLGASALHAAEPSKLTSFVLDERESLIRVGVTPMNVTKGARAAAQMVWDAISNNDPESAKKAVAAYDELIPLENLGGDYTAMQWLCRDLIATHEGRKPEYDAIARFYRERLSKDGYKELKEYLQLKYGIADPKVDDAVLQKERRRVLEDFVMFLNPERESWESSKSILDLLNLKPGAKIADIGCGYGYFSLPMAERVGPDGRVFAIDTDKSYTESVMEFAAMKGVTNITPVVSLTTDTKIPEKVDVAFIASLYHVIYGWSTEPDRRLFLDSIRKSLKPDGRLVIVDNLKARGRELHSCFVDRRLVTTQLHHYGFVEDFYAEVSPLRYMLVMKLARPGERPLLAPHRADKEKGNDDIIEVHSGNSLVHIGSLDSYDITEGGIAAARKVLAALETKDPAIAREAIRMYDRLIPAENFGGEFTALQWFCEHMIATPEKQAEMLADPLTKAYFHYLGDGDYDLLKDFVKSKYKLAKAGEPTRLVDEPEQAPPPKDGKDAEPGKTPPAPASGPVGGARSTAIRPSQEATNPNVGKVQRTFLEDFILFNNPRRPKWENTEKIMSLMPIKPGDKVADVGCGSGYFTFRFAKMVGDKGKVWAMDIKQPHLDFINEFKAANGISNVETLKATEDDIRLTDKVDVAYMCSLYHILYGVAPEDGRRSLMASIKRALKPGGLFVVVDNGPVEDKTLPYHGPYLAKEIAINQIERFGFKFQSYEQIIPQRYMLVFKYDTLE